MRNILLLGGLASVSALGQVPILRTQDPSISPDGKKIAFAWQGDIWLAATSGGEAKRLTVHPAPDQFPIWSRDGKQIVFASARYGNNDVFRMDVTGSNLERLSFGSSAEYPTSLAPDGTIYGYSTAWGRLDIFMLPSKGGDIIRLSPHPLEMEYYPDVSPDGSRVLFNTAGSAGHWRKPGQSGSNTAEIWVVDRAAIPFTGMKQVTKNNTVELFPRFVTNNQIAFIGNEAGKIPNLFVMDLNGRGKKQVTQFTSGTMRSLSIGSGQAVYQKDSALYHTDLKSGKTSMIELYAPDDMRRNPIQELSISRASDIAISPDQLRAVVEVRGDLFLIPAGGGTTVQLTHNPSLDTDPVWLSDTTVLYVEASSHSRRVFKTVSVAGVNSTNGVDSPKLFFEPSDPNGDVLTPVLSPDRKWIAFHSGKRDLMVMPVAGGSAKKVAEGDFVGAYYGQPGFSWSPDSEWLAVLRQRSRSVQISLVKRDGSQEILVAKIGKGASVPVFSSDGRSLFFGAVEGLDYSEIRQNRTAPTVVDLIPRDVTFFEDDLDMIGQDSPKPKDPAVKVQEEGIFMRKRDIGGTFQDAWPMKSGNGVYANLNGEFVRYNPTTGSRSQVPGVSGTVSQVVDTGKRVYIIQGGRVSILTQNGTSPVNFTAISRVDQQAEEMAIFNEAWWALDRLFYDPKMHGKDWDAIHDEFAKIVPHVTSRIDFYDLMEEMIERLDSSHQGANSPESYDSPDNDATGWLGVEWNSTLLAKGTFQVEKVYRGSPAMHPDSRLEVGDVLVSVNGKPFGQGTSLAQMLRGETGRKVILEIRRGRDAQTHKVTIKPISLGAFSATAYEDWVAANKQMVSELSGGKVGYIHIQGMNAPSLSTFLTEIATDLEGKQGVVIDVRYNGGGYTAQIILNVMRKVPWLIRTSNDLPDTQFSENIYRGNSMELPSATLINEYSFSNAEIFAEGIRQMDIGVLVGEETGGAVIGTSSYGFWDGGSIRMPSGGSFTLNGENLEGNGRKPDVSVIWNPNWGSEGVDPQLRRAVEEVLKQIG